MLSIHPTETEDASRIAACIDSVARERLFLGNTKGFSPEQTREFIQFVKSAGGVHLVALDGDDVVGWCDVTPQIYEGLTHAGRLGMGLLPEYRGQGWGTKLVTEALSIAFKAGFERIELEVFASNVGAIKLYRYFGFCEEGKKRKARKLDGMYDDIFLFGLLREEWVR
ncbi:GNAT family N-acetyltransferase [Prosthecochloris sp.]|uniref:GNAT family N-acetyltransferase n=1 Tax=Prosthecochloris sp. TaxID=290513 RepID=UPI00257D22BC|nr:GNAT family N-acetyltransferase [Prosthecochloris sp.]